MSARFLYLGVWRSPPRVDRAGCRSGGGRAPAAPSADLDQPGLAVRSPVPPGRDERRGKAPLDAGPGADRAAVPGIGLHRTVGNPPNPAVQPQPFNRGNHVVGNPASHTAGTPIASGVNILRQGPPAVVRPAQESTIVDNTSRHTQAVALIQRGTCTFVSKVANAIAAGAAQRLDLVAGSFGYLVSVALTAGAGMALRLGGRARGGGERGIAHRRRRRRRPSPSAADDLPWTGDEPVGDDGAGDEWSR